MFIRLWVINGIGSGSVLLPGPGDRIPGLRNIFRHNIRGVIKPCLNCVGFMSDGLFSYSNKKITPVSSGLNKPMVI